MLKHSPEIISNEQCKSNQNLFINFQIISSRYEIISRISWVADVQYNLFMISLKHFISATIVHLKITDAFAMIQCNFLQNNM